jgi:protein gp37
MTDLFGDWVTNAQLDRIFAVMALCPQHTFQVLTKRAQAPTTLTAAVFGDPPPGRSALDRKVRR